MKRKKEVKEDIKKSQFLEINGVRYGKGDTVLIGDIVDIEKNEE